MIGVGFAFVSGPEPSQAPNPAGFHGGFDVLRAQCHLGDREENGDRQQNTGMGFTPKPPKSVPTSGKAHLNPPLHHLGTEREPRAQNGRLVGSGLDSSSTSPKS